MMQTRESERGGGSSVLTNERYTAQPSASGVAQFFPHQKHAVSGDGEVGSQRAGGGRAAQREGELGEQRERRGVPHLRAERRGEGICWGLYRIGK